MFSPDIVGSDAFIEMPVTAQCLYFHLGMRADDDGFVNPQITMRMVGANGDDLKILIAKRFLLQFQNGVVVVKHWRINNFIRKDRYKETNYLDEKRQLRVKENQAYTLDENQGNPIYLVPWKSEADMRSTIGQPNDSTTVNAGKVRIGKDRIGEVRIDNNFARFWSAYPVKKGKGTAEKAWNKYNPNIDVVLSAIENQKTTDQWSKDKGKYIPYPATWLNGKRWEDEVEVATISKFSKYDN